MIAVDELHEFQLHEQRIECAAVRLLHQIRLRREFDRRVAADGRQIVGKIRLIAVCFQLLAQVFLDLGQMRINSVERSVLQQQARGRFRPDARDARNVVRAVAHQALEIDQALRLKAVFLGKFRLVVERRKRLPGLAGDELDRDMPVDQLEAIAVAGDDHAVPARFAAAPSDRAKNIVGLPALALVDRDAHRAQHVLHIRKLHGQLLRHRMTRRLIAVELQMPEGRRLEIERHAQRIGCFLLAKPLENIQKAVDGVGAEPLLGGQDAHAVKCAVKDAVAVENHELHNAFPLRSNVRILFILAQMHAACNPKAHASQKRFSESVLCALQLVYLPCIMKL